MTHWWSRFFLLLVLACTPTAWAEVPVPPLQARVTDLTHTLSAGETASLEAAAQAFETQGGGQLAILIVPTTQPEAIEQYSLRVAESWKLGAKGKDDGLLLLVAKQDRKIRIEVGYGLEGTIPDAIARRVIDETIAPRFKAGDFAGGLMDGVERLTHIVIPTAAQTAPAPPASAGTTPATGPHGIPSTPTAQVIDLTGRLPEERTLAWSNALNDFYDSDGAARTKPAYIVVVPTVGADAIDSVAVAALQSWGKNDNLDVDRSLLLLIAADDAKATVVTGAGLGATIPDGMRERLVSETLVPLLRSGKLEESVDAGVHGLESIVDAAHENRPIAEHIADELYSLPVWLIVALIAIATLVRWMLGPLPGATVMASAMGAGAWFVSGHDMMAVLIATGVTFILVLVGLANWVSMVADSAFSGGSGGGGGGFSGGGGGFGGGGASGGW